MRMTLLGLLLIAPTVALADDNCSHAAPRSLALDLAGVKTLRVETNQHDVRLRGAPGASHTLKGRACASRPEWLPELTLTQILKWADAHHARTGLWPTRKSGLVTDALGERWSAINSCLVQGLRGLRPGSSLARLLARYRGVRNIHGLPDFSVAQILAWADAHHRRTGEWPTQDSGPIVGAPGEKWMGVDVALNKGGRGLPGGITVTAERPR